MKERKNKLIKDKPKDKPNKLVFNISVPYLPIINCINLYLKFIYPPISFFITVL